MRKNCLILFLLSFFTSTIASSQQVYQYSVDLTTVTDYMLTVNLIPPAISQKESRFYLPKIVRGTYMNSNFAKYVHNLQALDKEGKLLPMRDDADNGWTIMYIPVKVSHHSALK